MVMRKSFKRTSDDSDRGLQVERFESTEEAIEEDLEKGGDVDVEVEIETDESPVDKILQFLQVENVAEALDEKLLKKVAAQVKNDFDEDEDSMVDWQGIVEKGQELMAQEFSARAEPWENAANFKSPVIMNSVLRFGDTASQELLRKNELVKSDVLGRDPQGIKFKQGNRVAEFMNFQLNVEMTEWREEHDRLLYTLPSTGCMFKKTFFDQGLGRNVSDVIYFPNFVVNQANTTIESAPSFTHIQQFTENEVIEKERTGQWLKVDFVLDDDNITEQAEENTDRFLEQHGWYDLDEDGYKEPYVVTLHEATGSIVRIVPRYMPQDVIVKVSTGDLADLPTALDAVTQAPQLVHIEEVAIIEPVNMLTKYDFLPDPEGNFLGIGYPHLLAGLTQGINTITNQLLDAGSLSNLPGGYLAKGVRKKLGQDKFQPGEWKGTNVPPRDLGSAFFPLPFKEPSQTLFALNEKLQQEAEKTSASADFSKVLGTNAPATTTLALLQEETKATTSIIRRIYLAMSKEFKKLALLDGRFVDPELYAQVLDDPEANFETDFDVSQINFTPVANPEMSTRMERVKANEVQMNFLPQITEAGGQTQVVIQNFLDSLGVENVPEIFPEPQPEAIERNTAATEQQNQLQSFQNDLFNRELTVREMDLQRKIAETQSDIAETRADIIKKHSEAILNLEKAETEDQKNQLTTYTAELDALTKMLGVANQQAGQARANQNVRRVS